MILITSIGFTQTGPAGPERGAANTAIKNINDHKMTVIVIIITTIINITIIIIIFTLRDFINLGLKTSTTAIFQLENLNLWKINRNQ